MAYCRHASIRTARKYWHCATSLMRIRATFNKCSIRWRGTCRPQFSLCLHYRSSRIQVKILLHFSWWMFIISSVVLLYKQTFTSSVNLIWSKNLLFHTKNIISEHLTNSSERVNVWRSVFRFTPQNDYKCLRKLFLSSPSPKSWCYARIRTLHVFQW